MLHFIYYSTNIRTEYFKQAARSPFFLFEMPFISQCYLFLVPVLFTFYIQGVLKFKKKSDAKRLMGTGSFPGRGGVKRPGLRIDHSSPSKVGDKNE